MKNNLTYHVAGFCIRLYSEWQLLPETGYRNFVSDNSCEPDIWVDCREMKAKIIPSHAEKVFTSENDGVKFYEVYRDGNVLFFIIYDQLSGNGVQQYARLEPDMKHWTIWSGVKNEAMEPLVYPMGPILFHYAVLTAEAVMMHASGVFDGAKGRMFSGFSGTGKSTISGLWKDAGYQLINDDRLIIRREGEKYFIYNTPMYYEDENKKAPLDAVYLIRHFPENDIKKTNGAAAVSGIMAFSIQNNYDPRFVGHHIDFFSRMSEVVPIYRLGFVPDKNVIDFIRELS